MHPHTVTIWHITGETDRKATWSRQTLSMVRFEEKRGAVRHINGDVTEDSFLLLVPYDVDIAKDDRVSVGDVTSLTPPKDAHIVTSVEPVRIGNSLHHWEVEGT